ncbi:MAG: type IV toxin-antitoxin system AbiEi family antitoxin [Actinomycetota bacterium]
MATPKRLNVPDWLLSHGRTSASTSEIARILEISEDGVRARLRNSVKRNQMFSPARGLWVPIPPEYRNWGATPALEFLDSMMTYLERDYYVGWLSAAEILGASHQRPQVTQVAVSSQLSNLSIGRSQIRFRTRKNISELPRFKHRVPSGYVWVSSPELTALDLADATLMGGGLNNVATVLVELSKDNHLDGERLASIAVNYSTTAISRLGYILQVLDSNVDLKGLKLLLKTRRKLRPSLLSPSDRRAGKVSQEWNLLINTSLEPDL